MKRNTRTLERLRQSALAGDSRAQVSLGFAYEAGVVTKRDPQNALRWYERAAASGHTEACYLLGELMLNEWGGVYDVKNGVEWLTRAADKGNRSAMGALGHYYQEKTRKSQLAIKWLSKAAALNDALGLCGLALLLWKQARSMRGKRKALNMMVRAAEAGHRQAMYIAARWVEEGSAGMPDSVSAIRWYKSLVKTDDLLIIQDAALRIAQIYLEGRGVTQDTRKAIAWFKRDIAFGGEEGLHELARIYENGIGIRRNERLAVYWKERAKKW